MGNGPDSWAPPGEPASISLESAFLRTSLDPTGRALLEPVQGRRLRDAAPRSPLTVLCRPCLQCCLQCRLPVSGTLAACPGGGAPRLLCGDPSCRIRSADTASMLCWPAAPAVAVGAVGGQRGGWCPVLGENVERNLQAGCSPSVGCASLELMDLSPVPWPLNACGLSSACQPGGS